MTVQSKRGSGDLKSKPLTDDIEVTGHQLENISSSPVVVHVNRNYDEEPPRMSFDNEGN